MNAIKTQDDLKRYLMSFPFIGKVKVWTDVRNFNVNAKISFKWYIRWFAGGKGKEKYWDAIRSPLNNAIPLNIMIYWQK